MTTDRVVTLNAANIKKAHEELAQLKALGIDMHQITNVLLVEDGVKKFAQSYTSLLGAIDGELRKFQGASKA